MDVLSDVLKTVRLTGAIFFERHVHAPFAGESPPSAAIASVVMPDAEHMISFHAILSGSCWASVAAAGVPVAASRPKRPNMAAQAAKVCWPSSPSSCSSRWSASTSMTFPRKGWLSGLKYRHVGHALRLIHGQPAKPWTLATLAREVGLSRSVFADRFAHYVGVSPMHYLGRWRMQPHVSRPGATSRAICTSAAISGVSGSRCGMTRPTL